MKKYFLFQINSIFIIFLFFLNFSIYLQCPMNSLKKKIINSPKRNLIEHTKKRKRKIRIFIDDTYMKSQNNGKYTVVKNALTNAANYWSKILKVERLDFKLKKYMFDNCVMKQYHPDLDETKGIEADLIIFPFFMTLKTSSFFAVSDYCVTDSTLRPIGGVIQINNNINTGKRNSELFFTQVFMHELAHIFGFIYDKLEPFFITRTINGKSRTLLASPKVIQTARRHFNCQTLEGVELEDNGSDESKLQHWESRIMNGDLMVSFVDRVDVTISEITLAFLEDLGFYETKTYTGGLFRTGKGRGCSFLTTSCLSYSSVFSNDFNYNSNKISCSPTRLSYGYYIKEADYADNCPIVTKNANFDLTNYEQDYFPSSCTSGGGQSIFYEYGGKISSNSICVLTRASASGTGNSGKPFQAVCVKATCTKNYLYLTLDENNSVVCPRGGGLIRPADTEGPVLCPDYNLICTSDIYCTSILDCINKKSRPKKDTWTYNYSISTTLYMSSPGSVIQPEMDLNGEGLCRSYCSGCYRYNECNLCPSSYKLMVEPYTYCDNLGSYYYYVDSREYFRCDALEKGCRTCTKNYCKSCKGDYSYDRGDKECYLNKNLNPYCTRQGYDGCESCSSGYIMIESSDRCVNKNSYNMAEYYSNDGLRYIPCYKAMENCKECTSSTKCTKCNSGLYLVDNNSCKALSTLQNDQYITLDGGKTYNSCSNVMPYCNKCDNSTYCKECFEEYVFLSDPGNPRCVDDIDIEDVKDAIYDPINDIFVICNNGYKFIRFCDNSYSICVDQNKIDTSKYDSNNNCYITCSVKNCAECSSDPNKCNKCSSNYAIVNNDVSKCVSVNSLGNNYYTEDSGKHYYSCYYKFPNCNTCTINGDKCTKCFGGYYFLNQNYINCYKESDLISQYSNTIYKYNSYEYYSCYKGVSNCHTCSSGTYCHSCFDNYGLLCNKNDFCYSIKNSLSTYYKDNNLNCFKSCEEFGCSQCLSENNCQNCLSEYELYGARCYKKDGIKTFCTDENSIQKKCNEALPNCAYCLSCSVCTSCTGDNVIIYANENYYPCKKLSELNNEYYLNITNNVYYPCYMNLDNCKVCSNQNICLECLDKYALLVEEDFSSKCVLEKDINKKKYILAPDSKIKKYYPCSFYFKNCDLCENINSCEKCKNGFGFIDFDISKCENITNKDICSPNNIDFFSCSEGIMFCKKSRNNKCQECINEYTIFNDKENECVEIKYEYYSTKKFFTPDNRIHYYSCNYLIKDCFECSSREKCDDCNSGFVIIDDEKCENLNNLNTTLYYTDDGYHYYKCDKQIPFCLTCQGKEICSLCYPNYAIINNDYSKCVENKNYINNDEYYTKDNGTSYIKCSNSITNCFRCENESICKECYDNNALIENDLSKCIPIESVDYENCEEISNKRYKCYYNKIDNCKKYFNIKKDRCLECEEDYSIINDDFTKCKLKQDYINNKLFYTENEGKNFYSCDKKIINCYECTSNGTQCLKCSKNYYFINQNYNVCYNENVLKKNQYYLVNDLEYYKCDYKGVNNCDYCLSGTHCIKCKNNFTLLDEDNSKCHSINNLTKEYYRKDEFYYASCHKAIMGCKECINSEYCSNCSEHYILSNDKRKCTWDPNIGNTFIEYENGTKIECFKLMDDCDFCLSENFCTVCNRKILVEELNKTRHCIDNNNNKEYYPIDSLGNLYYNCKIGVSNCKSCESNNYCIICEKPYGRIYNNYSYCFSTEELKQLGNYYIKNKEDGNYYPCNYYMSNCKQCSTENKCITCEEKYSFLNKDNSKCIFEDDLINQGFCTDDNGKNYYTCEQNIIHCEQGRMKKCDKCQSNYTILNSNKKQCIDIASLNPKNNYYTDNDGLNYFSCDYNIDWCEICEKKNNLICKKCKENYAIIQKRNKCYIVDEKGLNSYYLTYDEDGNYIYKLCISNCKKCTDDKICNQCNEQFILNKAKTRCIPSYECTKVEINDILTLTDIDISKYISSFSEKEDESLIYIINGPNNEYKIIMTHGDVCNEDLLKNKYFSFNLIEANNALRLRLLDEIANDSINIDLSQDLESPFKVIINNNINNTSSIELYSNDGKQIDLDIYSNISYEKNISNIIENKKAIEAIKLIEEKDINIFDENDKIFNDLCEPLSFGNYDIPLKDRKELLLIKEESFCENNCYLENIYFNDLIYKCNCKIENGIIFNQNGEMKKTNINKMSISENIKNYFQYLKCKINLENIKINPYFYIFIIILIGQIFLLILYICLYIRKTKIKGNPPKKVIEKNFPLDAIDTDKKTIDIFQTEKNTKTKIKTNSDKKSQITAIDNNYIKKEENNFCYYYRHYISSKFTIFNLMKRNKLKTIENLSKILFMLILSTYICSISFDQNIISDKYFSNENQIVFIIKSQYVFIILSALVLLIFDFLVSFSIQSSKKLKKNMIYLLIFQIIFSAFLFYSIIEFCSIYPKMILDLFIQFVFFNVTYYLFKLMLLSTLFMIYYYRKKSVRNIYI